MTDQQPTDNRPRTSLAMRVLYACIVAAAVFVAIYTILQSSRRTGKCAPGEGCNAIAPELRKTDPKLIKFRETGKIQTSMRNPRGIAVGPGGDAYMVGDKIIKVYGADRTRKPDIPLLEDAECLAVDRDGRVYVGLRDRVAVYAGPAPRAAPPIAMWPGLGDRAFITCIAVTATDVFVADAGNRVILRYDKAGKVLTRIGEKNAARNIPGLVVPSHHLDVAMAPDGLLRVANPGRHCIEAYTLDGDLEQSWGKPSTDPEGFPGCCNPTDIAIFPDGGLVAADKGLFRVKVYAADGTFTGVVAGPESFGKLFLKGNSDDFAGIDLAVDGDRVLVLDPASRTIRIFEPIPAPAAEATQ